MHNIIQTPNTTIGPLALLGFFIIGRLVYIVLQVKELVYKPVSILKVPAAFQKKYGITRREKEIVQLLFKGLSYKEIMTELSITMPTVKSHISNVYRKTNTYSKIGLALLIKKQS